MIAARLCSKHTTLKRRKVDKLFKFVRRFLSPYVRTLTFFMYKLSTLLHKKVCQARPILIYVTVVYLFVQIIHFLKICTFKLLYLPSTLMNVYWLSVLEGI